MGQPVAFALTQNHKLPCNIRRFFFLKLLFCDFSTINFVHDDRMSKVEQDWERLATAAMVVYSLGAPDTAQTEKIGAPVQGRPVKWC